MARPERGSYDLSQRGGALSGFLLTLLVLALFAGLAYYAASDNHRRYRLVARNDNLVVERGAMFPYGFKPFLTDTPALKRAYEPLPLPAGTALASEEVFEDRAELDRALFALISGWARARLDAKAGSEFELAVVYAQRAELLPGLSEEQRAELKALRADLSYRRGKRYLAEAEQALLNAREALRSSIELDPSRPTDADKWLSEVDRRIQSITGAPQAADGGATTPAHEAPAAPTSERL